MIKMTKPLVSIILLNWNGYDDTLEALESLYQINYPNYNVIVVDNHSTNESIEKITEYKPNLIILTTHRYFHLTNAIKSYPQTSKLPIFILSTSASIEEFEKYEANDYLSKPIDVFKFVNKIENLIK